MTSQEEKKIRNLIEYVLRNKASDSNTYDFHIVKKDEKELDFIGKDIFSLSEFVMDTIKFHEPIKKVMFVFSNGNTHSVSFDKIEKEVLLVGNGNSGLMGTNTTGDIENLISDKATELFLKFKTENDLVEAKKNLADVQIQLSRALSDNAELKERLTKFEAQHEKVIKKLTDDYEKEIEEMEDEYDGIIAEMRQDMNITQGIKEMGLGLIEKIPSDTFDTLIKKSPVIQKGLGISPDDFQEEQPAIQPCNHADLSEPNAKIKPHLHKIYNQLCKLSPKDFGKIFNLLVIIFKKNIPTELIVNFINAHQSESHDNNNDSNSNN